MNRIGILGGTFNPIHIGHLMLAECAMEELRLDEVWLIPTGYSYLKEDQMRSARMPSARERMEMLCLAAGDIPGFRCLDIEIRREGNTYSYETLEELKRVYPEHEFYFIQGSDCLFSIESWKEPQRIFRCCSLVAAVRDEASEAEMEDKAAQLGEEYDANVILLPFRRLQISSTEIRERVRLGKSIRYMVPERVCAYIKEKGFYRDEDDRTKED